jgi:hypothetical protein
MSLSRIAVLAALLAALGCAPERVVFVDDEVPLAAPLEASLDSGSLALEQDDPPSRAIRLSCAEGGVSRQPAGLDDWAPAAVNLPLAAGDALWVPAGGRAELQAGPTALRLTGATGVEVLRLDSRALQLGLPRGAMELSLLPGRDLDSVEVDTPAGAVMLNQPGTYRVDADPDSAAGRVTVRSGLAEVTASGVTVPVQAGATLELAGGEPPSYDLVAQRAPDAFDQWCALRQQRQDGSESAVYLGRDMPGCADLDGQGEWKLQPGYGTAWAPRVSAGWAPYRDGRWVWSEPWGWTWVDDAPWGYATSHYGRWTQADGAWLWLPYAEGMRGSRPVYAPALVAFVGGPGLHGPAGAAGGVAWFPLGPRESYQPAYPASRAYLQAVNAASLPPGAPASAAHVNRDLPGALTAVPQSVFLGARPVAAAALAVHGQGQGLRVGGAPALVPGRESVLAGPAGAAPPAWGRATLQVRNHLPLAVVPFESRQRALAAGQGRPLGAPALTGLRRQDPAVRAIPARLATSPAPGGSLRPARPGLSPFHPGGPRPFSPPSGAMGGQPAGRGAQAPPPRPGSVPPRNPPGAQQRGQAPGGQGRPNGQNGPRRFQGQGRKQPRRVNPVRPQGRGEGREGGGERQREPR